jgi:hypothetical protein
VSRSLRPRVTSALAVAPATVTDLTSPVVLGLEPRCFRELLAREKIAHARIGRRVVARLEAVLAAVDRLSSEGASAPPGGSAPDTLDEEPSADQILARIGRIRGSR